jgi:hypothetical protein
MMSLSTIVVAANAQLLRRLNLRPHDPDPHDHGAGGKDSERVDPRARDRERV